jgi:hypothetical protein
MDKINGLKVCFFCENLRGLRETIKISGKTRRFSQNLFIKLFCPFTYLKISNAIGSFFQPGKNCLKLSILNYQLSIILWVLGQNNC